MKVPVFVLGAIAALGAFFALIPPANAATALNGAKIDPLNLIDDAIETEALTAYARHAARQPFKGDEIVIVDYALPSSARRLYILNIRTGAVEAHYVAHGRGSDPAHTKMAVRFSDAETSGMSSVGAYRGLARYRSGTHGPALRLEGLDHTNASALQRLIVFHTAPYFDPANGRFGRSCGCFVVTKTDMTRVYDVIADGGFLYAGPARLHDTRATRARDCNTECGNKCPDAPLLADAKPAKPAPVTVAAAAIPVPPLPAPAPRPQPAPEPAPVVTLAALKPEAPVAPAPRVAAFNAPVPKAKPQFAAPEEVAAVFDAPIPRLKPALDAETIDADARDALVALLAAKTAPRAVTVERPIVVAADIPVPQAKPGALTGRDETPRLAATPLVPVVAPGETPVPTAKPAGLRQTADASGERT